MVDEATRRDGDGYHGAGMPPAVDADDAVGVPRQGAPAMTPSSLDSHPRAEAVSHTDLRLVNLLLAVLAAACVVAALAGSIVH